MQAAVTAAPTHTSALAEVVNRLLGHQRDQRLEECVHGSDEPVEQPEQPALAIGTALGASNTTAGNVAGSHPHYRSRVPVPGDEVTWREACGILGVGMRRLGVLVANGELTRGPRWQHRQLSRLEVETLALRRWNPRTAAPDYYWLGTKEAAELLGVNRARVRRLVAAGLSPFEQSPHGYAFRREQLLTVANARRGQVSRLMTGAQRPLSHVVWQA